MLACVVNYGFLLTWKERMHFAKRGLAWKASVNDTTMKINSFTAGHVEPQRSCLVSGVLISFWLQPMPWLGGKSGEQNN